MTKEGAVYYTASYRFDTDEPVEDMKREIEGKLQRDIAEASGVYVPLEYINILIHDTWAKTSLGLWPQDAGGPRYLATGIALINAETLEVYTYG